MAIIRHKSILTILALVGIFIIISYSFLYWLLVHINITSFYGLDKESHIIDYLYFSVTTIVATGFGDIIPQTAIAKILVISEIIIGVIVMGLMIYFNIKRITFRNKKGNY